MSTTSSSESPEVPRFNPLAHDLDYFVQIVPGFKAERDELIIDEMHGQPARYVYYVNVAGLSMAESLAFLRRAREQFRRARRAS